MRGNRDLSDPRYRAKPHRGQLVETGSALSRGIGIGGQIGRDRRDVVRADAGGKLLQIEKGPEEQAGPADQHQRQRYFADDDRAPHATGGARRSANGLAQRGHEIAELRLQRGQRSHDGCDDKDDGRDEADDTPIDADVGGEWQRFGQDSRRRANQEERHGDSGETAERAEDQALGEELRGEAAASGAEGRTHREFLVPRHAAGEEEVGDVCARDQQHQRRRAEGHDDGAAEPVADQQRLERLDDNRPVTFVERRDIGKRCMDPAHLLPGLVERAGGREPPVDGQPVVVPNQIVRVEDQGLPEPRLIAVECAGRQHANDAMRLAVDHHVAGKNVGVGSEDGLPRHVAEHDDRRGAGPIIAGLKRTSALGGNGKDAEVVGGDRLAG